MSAVDVTFTVLAIVAFAATAWVTAIIAWRLIKGPKR
jgi:hypothetical protein